MATGASGTFSYRASGGGDADYYLEITWVQEYTPGNNYSDIKISAKIRRSGGNATGGTWFAWQDGGISVNGTRVISWYAKSTSGSWTYSGASVSIGSGSVRVYHTGATTVPLATTAVDWTNTSVSSASFFFPEKSETLSLHAIPQPHTLTISAGAGTTVTVNRTSSPMGAGTGVLSSGAAIYDGDVLQVSAAVGSGWELSGLTANGAAIANGGTLTVNGDVTIAATAKQLGLCYIGGVKYLCYIGGVQYKPMIGAADGSRWILLS